MILLHDNAGPHRVLHTCAHLRATGVTMLEHPPYSLDILPCDYFLFPPLKKELCGHRFPNIDALKDEVDRVLHQIPVHEYRAVILDLPRRWRLCVQQQGGYFEGLRKQAES